MNLKQCFSVSPGSPACSPGLFPLPSLYSRSRHAVHAVTGSNWLASLDDTVEEGTFVVLALQLVEETVLFAGGGG